MKFKTMKYLPLKEAITHIVVTMLDNRHVSQMYKDWVDVDISCDCPQDVDDKTDIESIWENCGAWFGFKHVESPFDSNDFLIMVDAYGGGSPQIVDVCSGESSMDIIANLRYAIKQCCSANGYGLRDDEYVLIEELR